MRTTVWRGGYARDVVAHDAQDEERGHGDHRDPGRQTDEPRCVPPRVAVNRAVAGPAKDAPGTPGGKDEASRNPQARAQHCDHNPQQGAVSAADDVAHGVGVAVGRGSERRQPGLAKATGEAGRRRCVRAGGKTEDLLQERDDPSLGMGHSPPTLRAPTILPSRHQMAKALAGKPIVLPRRR